MALHNEPLDMKIDKDNPENGIKQLLRFIKPSWKLEVLTIEVLSGGYSSKIFCCYAQDADDKVTVRIRHLMEGCEDDLHIETKAIQHFASLGHFTTVHAIFSNGYCYQFIVGKPMINNKLKTGYINDEMLRAIAKEMAFIHSVEVPTVEYNECLYFSKMRDAIKFLPDNTTIKSAPSTEMFINEFNIIEKYLVSLKLPLGLSHGDSHPGNIIWNQSENKITFIDWELAGVYYQFYDVAYFLVFFEIRDPSISPAMKMNIPNNTSDLFQKYYFEEYCALKSEKVTETSFREFKCKVNKLKLAPLLAFTTFSVFSPDIMEAFSGDVNIFFRGCLNSYLQLKKEVLNISEFGE